jgi:glycine/betaine/sarcosine/D-proline reductase family selenoprotein B
MAEADGPVPYMERTRRYYEALGYAPYRWAHHDAAPFAPLRRRLAESRIALVTTAAPFRPELGDQGPGAPYNAAAKFYAVYSGDTEQDHDLRIAHVAYDRQHTAATDPNTWFPLPALRRLAAEGVIGALTPRFHGLPTNRSQRHTLAVDIAALLRRVQEDGADAAVLVPNCPVCHQSCALAARHLEAAGIPTVVIGCARDIVEHCAVPRFLWSDFPLGNSAGRPHDPASQRETLRLALGLLADASGPRTTLASPLRWDGSGAWKRDYCNVDRIPPAELARRRAVFQQEKEVARQVRVAGQLTQV